MTSKFMAYAIRAVVFGLAVVTMWGCEKVRSPLPVAEFAPTVRITSAPIDTNIVCDPKTNPTSCYSITVNWVGNDSDGRVDYYLYAVDPPSPQHSDTTWVKTTLNESRLVFTAANPVPGKDSLKTARQFHTFVIVAVDNQGLWSARVNRSFFSYTTAPTVRIQAPRPSELLQPLLTPSVRITWSGSDVDGVFSAKPVRYRYLLMGAGTEYPGGLAAAVRDPDGVRRYYAPDFPEERGWTETSADSTTAQFTNLNPNAEYIFVVVGFDEAGAYSPVFTFDSNMLRFTVGFAGTLGPVISMFNEFFFYHYSGGGWTPTPSAWVNIEVPAAQPITFNWLAEPPQGADIRAYRWMLDGDVTDETPRTDELTDYKHWSSPSVNITSAIVGPFSGDPGDIDHFFYIEAEDNTGLRSLGIVHFTVVKATFDRPLLIVDDTRFGPDRLLPNQSYDKPKGPWPSAAELDTFLFAVGGNDYSVSYPRGPYPAGLKSSPGLFKGYPFDTFGTRIGRSDLTVPLSVLGKYAHVVWIVDGGAATNGKGGTDGNEPMTALRYMSQASKVNTLAAYVKQGGLAWLTGGGGAYASQFPRDDGNNNHPTTTFSSITSQKRELAPGTFMYDLPKWQSEIRIASAPAIASRYLGRLESNPGLYAGLPPVMNIKTPATDTVPMFRTPSQFYLFNFAYEFLQKDNYIREPIRTDPSDFTIDTFDYPDNVTLKTIWATTDSLNTVLSQTAGVPGKAMQVATQGGGGSTGDAVSRTFPDPRDWGGLTSIRFQMKQDQPASALQWRIRIVDDRGASVSAPIPVGALNTFENKTIPLRDLHTDSATQPNLTRVKRVEFALDTGGSAGTAAFDQLTIASVFEEEVLDTLYVANGQSLPDPTENPANVVMSYYHGHDSTPFVFTGFNIWGYRRSDCVQLIDFVLQRLWGMSRSNSFQGPSALRRVAMERARVQPRPNQAPQTPRVGAGGRRLPSAADRLNSQRRPSGQDKR
jgi:hypothetical protein